MTENKKDLNLEKLVNKLQTDGIDKANAKRKEIIKKAEKQAETIREKAEEQADSLLKKAKADAENFQKNAIASIELAGRDMILSLKAKVTELFDSALKMEITETIDDDLLVNLIVKLVDNWSREQSVELQLNNEDINKLLKQIQRSVNRSFKDCVEIKHNRDISKGFRIYLKDEEINYDFTDETIAEALKIHINPKLAELIKVKK